MAPPKLPVRLKIPIWSALGRLQRVLLGAVVVVVALFIASVSVGASQEPGDPASHPDGFVGWLGDLVGGPPAADRADRTGPCLVEDGTALQVDGSCVVTVAASDESLRRITLRAKDAVTVVAPVPRGDSTATSDLAAGDELAVDIDADGGDITITCPSGGTCAVGLN
ncbi:hypothetical protein GCM10009682_58340 [Luedemannella flava]|uniref:DUF5666 domain-containing protein n=1 Tax=Luedemannella flava TaxID=349316 RepID=A0ABP4YYU2_9ACTN